VLLCVLAAAVAVAGGARVERADFTFNNGAEITTLDPAAVSGVPEGRVLRAVFEGLCVKDPRTLEPRPGAAESWELSADRKTYTFHIRRGARWTNGDPLTAHDFVFSWERFLNPMTAAEYAYQLWYVRGAREYTQLVDDRLYRASWIHNVWAKEIAPGRWRVGFCGYRLAEMDPDLRPAISVAVGDELEAGEAFVDFSGGSGQGHFHVPLDGRVTAVNRDLPATAGALRADPYEAGWMVELEVSPESVERELAAGELIPGERFRSEWAWPHKVGIRALDDHTLEVRLDAPTPYFLDLVAFYPLFPVNRRNLEQARERWPGSWRLEWMRPANIVTNGPFKLLFRRVNDRIRLVKNPDYWDADEVALETIDVLAVDHLGTSLNLYLTGAVDWIDRPITNVVPRLRLREDFDPAPYLGSYFYRVNTTRPPFDDARVRRALALSIERVTICTNVTKAGEEPAWGLCPPGMGAYVTAEMDSRARRERAAGSYAEGFARDVERARALLAQAGYGPGAKPLPTIEIHYNTDQTHKDIAEVIADGWKRHLGLNVKLLNQEWKVYLDAQKTLDYDVSRSAWIGDYADPNTFLDLFVTGGENNRTGWGDARYDQAIRRAAVESDPAARLRHFAAAEALLMEELPILPIYYYVTRNLVNPRLGGFHENVQDEHFPKFWYWMDDAELAARRAARPDGREQVEAHGPRAGLYSPARRRARGDE